MGNFEAASRHAAAAANTILLEELREAQMHAQGQFGSNVYPETLLALGFRFSSSSSSSSSSSLPTTAAPAPATTTVSGTLGDKLRARLLRLRRLCLALHGCFLYLRGDLAASAAVLSSAVAIRGGVGLGVGAGGSIALGSNNDWEGDEARPVVRRHSNASGVPVSSPSSSR